MIEATPQLLILCKQAISPEHMHDAIRGLQVSSHTSKAPGDHVLGLSSSTVEKAKSVTNIDAPTQTLSAAPLLLMQSKLEHVLTRSEMDIIDLLEQATTRLCSAARVLQKSQLCCDSFTLVISRDPSISDHVVDLVSISFQILKDLRDSVVALQEAIRTEYNWGLLPLPLDAIHRCSIISRELLRIFAPASTPECTLPGWFSDSSFSSQLHICSLVTQVLSLGLAFYTQAHVGPCSPFFLEYPLTDFILTGTMDRGIHIRACLRELTCLRGMVGEPVFVFASLNARPLDTWQKSSQLSHPLDLRGSGIDIADTWGPGLLISTPKVAYGYGVHVI